MFKFEEFNVYQEALVFIDKIYILTASWLKDEIFGITNELRRASVSIALIIAEGSSRTRKDFQHFLSLSRGSIYECVAIREIARNRKHITSDEYKSFYEMCLKLAKMTSGLKSSLK